MRARGLLTLLLSGAVAVACSEREPAAPVAPGHPAFDFMNNPDNGNPRIVRYGAHYALSWTDPQTGLRATHTTVPISFEGNPETDCGPQQILDPIAEQDVGLLLDPFFISQIRANAKGPVWVIIRDVTQAGECYGNKLVAEGMGTLHYADNDIFGPGSEANNVNAWGFVGKGELTTTDGTPVHYSGHLRYTWKDGEDPQVRTSEVTLK